MALTVLGAVLILAVVPTMVSGIRQYNLDQAIARLIQEGYVAFASPTGELVVEGDLYTRDVYSQADSTHDIGAAGNEYQGAYVDSLYLTAVNPATASDLTMWGSSAGTGLVHRLDATDADAGNTVRDAPTIAQRANYWTGAVSQSWDYSVAHDMQTAAATPKSVVTHSINAVNTLSLQNDNGTPGVIVPNTHGIDYSPSSDTDTTLITVGVTGSPVVMWDESEDRYSANKGINLTDIDAQVNVVASSTSHGANGGLEGVVRATVRASNISDNTATNIFTITTDDYTGGTGNFDGGSYTCFVRGVVVHEFINNSGNRAAKGFSAAFTHVNIHTGNGTQSAVTELYESAEVGLSPSSRGIGTVTMTVVETSDYVNTIDFTIDLTGTGVTTASATLLIEIVWEGYRGVAPIVASL